jgi:predicted methyltransferase
MNHFGCGDTLLFLPSIFMPAIFPIPTCTVAAIRLLSFLEISEMAITAIHTEQQINFTNRIHHGDCIEIIKQMPANSVDFILTDPPYLP